MKEIKAVIRPHKIDPVLNALHHLGNLPSVVTSEVRVTDVVPGFYETETMTKIELVVPDEMEDAVIKAIEENARTGNVGDGRISVTPVHDSVVIRTGERGENAR